MCLTIKSGYKIDIAPKPIICWKVVTHESETKWQAIFRKTEYEYNKELIACETSRKKRKYNRTRISFYNR